VTPPPLPPTKKIGSFVIGAPSAAVALSTEGPTRLEANPLYYRASEQTQRFEHEWEQARKRQDAQLERLERGVGTLGEMARGMQVRGCCCYCFSVRGRHRNQRAPLPPSSPPTPSSPSPYHHHNLAQEELDKQAPIVEDIDQQLHKVTARLKSNNAKLKGLVLQMRSRRNFCLDVILICIVLGIVVYIVSLVQKQRQPQQASE
jgi:DNA repair exonuclease SbcCD ATPase subunit